MPVSLFGNWNFKDQSSFFQFKGANASLYLKQPVGAFGGTIKLTDGCPDAFMTVSEASNYLNFISGAVTTANGTTTLLGGALAVDELAFFLSGNTILVGEEVISYPIIVFGQGNKIIGSPLFDCVITLTDTNAVLEIGISTPLNNSVSLNGGCLKLLKDLTLLDGAFLLGGGYVDLGTYTLTLPPKYSFWDTCLIFQNSSHIEIKSTVDLDGTWTFSGDNQISTIKGYGTSKATLDLASGGNIIVGPKHQLNLSGLNVFGLGNTCGGGFSLDATATVRFEDCVLGLADTWTVSSGDLLVQAASCRIVTTGMDSLVLTGSLSRLVIDGVSLQYDSLNNPGRMPVKTCAGGSIVTLNKGDIIPGSVSTFASQLEMVGGSDEDYEIFLNTNLETNKYKVVKVKNETPETRIKVLFNGNGNKLVFTTGSVTTFQLDPNVDLFVRNTVIEGFDPDKFFFYGTGAAAGSLIFAENVTLLLSKDLVFSANTNPLRIEGVVILDGNGYSLTLTASEKLLVRDTGELSITNGKVVLADSHALALSTEQAVLSFFNTSIFIPGTKINFDTGSLNISGYTSFSALVGAGESCEAHFVFSSAGRLCINSASTMIIDRGLTFTCEPDISKDLTSVEIKKHLWLQDNTSRLQISSSTLDVRQQGIIFDIGNVDILGFSQIKVSTTPGAELEIYSTAEVNVAANASLQIDGPIKYL